MNNFWKYYNAWKDETSVLSVGNFDNDNFRLLCDPSNVPIEEMIEESYKILSERDDFIVHALDIYMEKYFGFQLFTYKGYVSLSDSRKAWLFLLSIVKADNHSKVAFINKEF